MNKYDLSILIPARNEMFLSRTVEDILKNKRGKTEIIVVLDGEWANPPLEDHPDVTIVYNPVALGQRGATNQACRLSKAKYVMKIDAHCALDEGFDVKMISEMKDNWTMIPMMYNLHAFDWVCTSCGHTRYQSPSDPCDKCGSKMERKIIWKPRLNKKSMFYRFDSTLHFQYWGDLGKRPESQGDIADTLSIQGSCFMLTRAKYWELNICDEEFGSWGQQGVEVALKTWMSGGEVKVNKKTWYSHMFRTQGRDFGFPYPQSQKQVEHARKYSRELLQGNKWPLATRTFESVLEQFAPVPEWHDNKNKNKGIVYYTRNKVNMKLAHKVRKQILKANLPIVSVSSKPMNFGKNIHLSLDGSYLEMFKKILAGLKAINTDIVFFCEDDVLYHPSHFDFTPPKKDVYYYDMNVWRVRAADGHAIHYDAKQLNMICGYREHLIKHYKKRIEILEEYVKVQEFVKLQAGEKSERFLQLIKEFNKYVRAMGFEPGTHTRAERVDDFKSEGYTASYPSLDIRHDSNLTASRWSKDQFRSQKNCQNWQESDTIPGWGVIKGRFNEILSSI